MTERGWVIYCCFWDCTGSASLFGSFNVFFIEWAYMGMTVTVVSQEATMCKSNTLGFIFSYQARSSVLLG